MKRMDRLMAIVIALQQRPETAQSLAEKFEVSKRTILRDMQSLSEMGIPLYSMTGPTGGFRLMDSYRLPPLQFDSQEALTILMALQALTRIVDTPFNKERWTVIDKIRSSLPEETLKQIEPILERPQVEVPLRNYKAPHLSALLEYTSEAKWLKVFYRSQNHQRWLNIFPKRIYTSNGFWYCEAYSVSHEEERLFRVDRMDRIEVIEPLDFERFDGIGIIEPSESVRMNGTENKQIHSKQKKSDTIRIKAKLTYKGMLRVEQDEHIGECVRAIADDEWEVDFHCPTREWTWAVRFFFTLGLHAEVLEPESLRKEIYEMADQLCRRYHDGKSGGTQFVEVK